MFLQSYLFTTESDKLDYKFGSIKQMDSFPRYLGESTIALSPSATDENARHRIRNDSAIQYNRRLGKMTFLWTYEQAIDPVVPEEDGRREVVSLDPGIFSFQSYYSESECGTIGQGAWNSSILPLCKAIDTMISKIAKLDTFDKQSVLTKSFIGKLAKFDIIGSDWQKENHFLTIEEFRQQIRSNPKLKKHLRALLHGNNPKLSKTLRCAFSEPGLLEKFRALMLNPIPSNNFVRVLTARDIKQTKRNLRRAIEQKQRRIKNLVDELHWQTINFLSKNFKTVVIPPFETQKMASKKNRKLRSVTVRGMMRLRHYQFRMRLENKLKQSGGTMVLQNEAYTSKTCTNCGKINQKLGGSREFKCKHCRMVLDRDANGARNILLRALTEQSAFFIMKRDSNGNPCSSCAQELSLIGGYPTLQADIQQSSLVVSSINSSWTLGLASSQSTWLVPFTTGDQGSFTVTVSTNHITTPKLFTGGFSNSDFTFAVAKLTGDITLSSTTSASLNSISLTDFKCNYAIAASAVWACAFPTTGVILLTSDAFTTFSHVSINVPQDYLTVNAKINSFELLNGYLAVELTNGVFLLGNLSDSGTITWTKPVSAAVSVQWPNQPFTEFSQTCNPFILLNGNAAYTVTQGVASTLDTSSITLGSFTFVSGGVSVVDCSNIKFLVRTTTQYYMYNWNSRFKQLLAFPTQVPQTTPMRLTSSMQNANLTLSLTNIQFSRYFSNDLYVYGNCLLYSNDGGSSFMLFKCFSSSYIVWLDTDSSGSFVFATNQSDIWYGHSTSKYLYQVAASSATVTRPFFINDVYQQIALAVNTNVLSITKTSPNLALTVSNQVFETCPYSQVQFTASSSAKYTRQLVSTSDLPSTIYMDKNSEYSFVISLKPSSAYLNRLDDLVAFVTVSDPSKIRVRATRLVNPSDDQIEYHVTITELGKQDYNLPGENLVVSSVKIALNDVGFACASDNQVAMAWKMDVFVGCAPFQEIQFDYTSTVCPEAETGIACSFFDTGLALNFTINDLIDGTSSHYNDYYFLSAVGGALLRKDISDFDDSLVETINLNYSRSDHSLLWRPEGDTSTQINGIPALHSDLNYVHWVCMQNSPCYNARPSSSALNKYHVKFRLSTLGLSNDHSYCIWTAEFPVMLYGIPLDFLTSVIITFCTLGACLLLSGGVMRWVFVKEQEALAKQNEMDIFGDQAKPTEKAKTNAGLAKAKAALQKKKEEIIATSVMHE